MNHEIHKKDHIQLKHTQLERNLSWHPAVAVSFAPMIGAGCSDIVGLNYEGINKV